MKTYECIVVNEAGKDTVNFYPENTPSDCLPANVKNFYGVITASSINELRHRARKMFASHIRIGYPV